jgi:hypothetical protein
MGFTECVQVDRAGNAAAELRLCADAQCSHAGRCSLAATLRDDEVPPAAALARNAAPQIALRGAAEVVVEMGVSCTKCTADTPVGAGIDGQQPWWLWWLVWCDC